ncbi:hypothetical protein Tco_0137769 [Tanacetum coccineum]
MNYQRPRDHLHEPDLYPEVPECVPMPLTTVLVVMKPVQLMSSSVDSVRRCCDSGYGGGDGGVGAAAYSAMRASMDGDIGADSSVSNASVSPAEGTGQQQVQHKSRPELGAPPTPRHISSRQMAPHSSHQYHHLRRHHRGSSSSFIPPLHPP